MSKGRRPGFVMTDEHRVKIQNSNVLNALVEHVEGKREMSSTQVTAGVALLKKVLPDLSQTEIKAEVEHRAVVRLPEPARTAEEWTPTASRLN